MAEVYLDQKYIGEVDSPREFVKKVRNERRNNNLPFSLNICYDSHFNEVRIELSKGRSRRPLIVVENGRPLLTET